MQNGNVSRNHSYHDPYRWNCTAVGYILDKQEYMGHTVLGKTICENFKTKKRRKATPDELMIFPDTHEAIIDEETWHTVQRVRKKGKRKLANGTYSHRLAGMVFCADCGSKLSYRSPHSQHRPNGKPMMQTALLSVQAIARCTVTVRCTLSKHRFWKRWRWMPFRK